MRLLESITVPILTTSLQTQEVEQINTKGRKAHEQIEDVSKRISSHSHNITFSQQKQFSGYLTFSETVSHARSSDLIDPSSSINVP